MRRPLPAGLDCELSSVQPRKEENELELLFLWLLSGVIGYLILSRYDKGGTGCLLGILLGPIGWIIAVVMRSNAAGE